MPAKSIVYASFLQRLLAFLIDLLFIVFVFHLPIWLISAVFKDPLASALLSFMTVALTSAYLVYFTSASGQTFGKKILKIKVIDIKTLAPPSIYLSLIREVVGKIISASIFFLGFFASIPDYKGRAWHDRISGTIVVKQF